jgi:hypothetical protein
MNSGMDLLAEGFPHSDTRGSTIARISPRLFAACHVLLRLLAPRHPPNALIALNTSTHTRTQDQAPRRLKAATNAQQFTHLNPTNQSDSPVKQHAVRLVHWTRPAAISSCSLRRAPGQNLSTTQENKTYGDGRIRTDDPLLAKQVLSR